MRAFDWDPIRAEHYGQRLHAAQTGRTHDRTRPMLQQLRKFLARRCRPHMTQSEHPVLQGPTCPDSARLTQLRLLDFRDRCYTGGGLLDHLNRDGFDCRSGRLFHFPRNLLHRRTFGLGLGNRPLRSLGYLACLTALSLVCSSQFGSVLCF